MDADLIINRLIARSRALAVERPLAPLMGARAEAPEWYSLLQETPPEELWPVVEGAKIEVLAWGKKGKPGVLLAHGNRAHARWWGPVAPLLAQDYRVVSLSYSGMGGSAWRSTYSFALQAKEVLEAARIGGLFEAEEPPVLIAHSFGGRGVVRAMATREKDLLGVVLVDSNLLPMRMPAERPADLRYDSMEAALARFNLKPSQPCANLFIVDDVARASVVERPDGWRWRFDPEYVQKFDMEDVWDHVARPASRLAFMYGEQSIVADSEMIAAQKRQAPRGTPFIGIPNAGHHLMFDQPIAVTAALRALIESWRSTAAQT